MNRVRVVVVGMLGAVAFAALGSSAAGTASVAATALPVVTGPVAVTGASHPFNGVAYDKTVRDLARDKYVEEEYFVSGTANVYDWPVDGSVTALGSGPYTTRILVRRPERAQAFSGNVVVELLNPTSLHDLDIVWSAAQQHFVDNGDVWVGVTAKPSSIADLKVYDGSRYGSLSMAAPVTIPCSGSAKWSAPAGSENGLVWDMTSQIGALLKSSEASNPLRGLDVKAVALTGYSQTAGYLTTYINAFATSATLASGKPVYDAYIPIAGANFPTQTWSCSPKPAPGSSRWVIQTPGSAPVIQMQTLSDYYKLGGFYSRRPDSTGVNGNFRLYEVAGAGHVWATQVAYTPSGAELVKAGFGADWWDPYCKGDLTTFPSEYAINGAVANLFRWVRSGIPAPIASRIQVSNPADPNATPLTDAYGNVLGGLRTPAIDVPTATYLGNTPGGGGGTCLTLWGSQLPLTEAQLHQLYSTHGAYVEAVTASATDAEAGDWITREDAQRIVKAAAQASVGKNP